MEDVVERPFDVDVGGDVELDEAEAVAAEEMRDVLRAAGDEVVDADDFVAAGEEEIAEVRAEEARAAGDQRTTHLHALPHPDIGGAADADVRESLGLHALRVVDVAQVDD